MSYKILGVFKYITVFLLLSLFVCLLYVAVIWFRGGDLLWLNFRRHYTCETFLENLRRGSLPPIKEHKQLYSLLHLLNSDRLGEIRSRSNIPYDYQFFFQDVAPAFLENPEHAAYNPTNDPYLLASFAPDMDYTARLLLLTGPESRIVKGKRLLKEYTKRLEMTGTYTSEFAYPTGLFVLKGEVLNPALQKWDGLVLLDTAGKLYIKDIAALEYHFRRFDIRGSRKDYLDFLELAEQQKFSMFQTHLLIKSGKVDVSPDSQRRARRRAIFQDQYHTVSVYDSFDEQPTLYELAETLRQKYGAVEAVNLDMGPYGYCARYEHVQQVKLYKGKSPSVQLSNIIVFHYK